MRFHEYEERSPFRDDYEEEDYPPYEDCLECEFWEDACQAEECPHNEDRYYESWDDPMYEDMVNPCDFRDPGGGSALRNGPLIYPCPNCGRENMLSPADKARGYQCDACADRLERGGY